jgi:hypothetical protein
MPTPWRSEPPPWCNEMVIPRSHPPIAGSSTPQAAVPASLPSEPATGRGRSHGTSSSEPYDRWFRYPAGFASDYVAILLRYLNLRSGHLVVDPFAGSAVTGTAAKSQGLSFFGIEAHPLIAELGSLKLNDPPGKGQELAAKGELLIKEAEKSAQKMTPIIYSETDLVQRCFEPQVLTKLTSLRALIKSDLSDDWAGYLKWALLATLRDVASVRVGWPYQRPGNKRKPKYSDPLARFRQRLSWMVADLEVSAANQGERPCSNIIHGDSRDPEAWAVLSSVKANGCISSPPYLNNFDYADATRLELYFWGEVRTWSEMCQSVRSQMITATTQQSSITEASSALSKLGNHSALKTIDKLTSELATERKERKRGKEYDRVLPAYFAAMAAVFENLSTHLSPKAPVVWLIGDSAPYGVYIDTPLLIAELAESFGFTCERDIVLRRRGERWTHSNTRHDMALSERLILLRSQ